MAVFRSNINIEADSRLVWSVLSRVTLWQNWLPTVTEVVALDGTEIVVGHRFHVSQPKLKPAIYQIKVIEPGRRFAWEAKLPGVRTWADHKLEPYGKLTQVTLTIEITGFLGRPLGFFAGNLTRSYLNQEASALKAMVESKR